MKDLVRLASLIPSWPWGKVCFLLCLGLLWRGVVSFDQALVLAMLALFIDRRNTRPKLKKP